MADHTRTANDARWAKIVGTTVVLTLLAIYIYAPYSPGGRQARNLALADEHLPKLEPLVKVDAWFTRVTVGTYTGNDGSLMLKGIVRSDEDLTVLKRLVESTSPPVRVTWFVNVLPPPAFDEFDN